MYTVHQLLQYIYHYILSTTILLVRLLDGQDVDRARYDGTVVFTPSVSLLQTEDVTTTFIFLADENPLK